VLLCKQGLTSTTSASCHDRGVQAAADTDRFLAQLPLQLERLAAKHGVPGASVAVQRGGEAVEAVTGVVSTRSGVPVTPDTLFMVQSVTKVLTATLVMQLVDEGLVALEDPVHLHLPEFRTADVAASRRVTVRHLLTHTGGFEGDIWAPTCSGGDALERFVVDLVGRARQDFPPGERFSYCNAGFGVLGRLVEVHRGLTYEKALRAYVAEPLGIGELAFSADQALAFRTAIGHVTNAIDATDAAPRPLRHWAVMPPSNPAAGNQLAMSARGLLAFARVHLQDGRSPGGGTVLAEATAQSMRRRQVDHPAVLGPHSHHGLGWWLERGELVEHAGGSTGVTALLRLAPRHDLAAVVLTNSESGGNLIDELLEPLFADLPGVAPPTPQPAMVPTPTHIDVREYIGTYASRQVRATVSRGDDGRLRLDGIALGDSLAMAALAGITVSDRHHELRGVADDVFLATGDPTGDQKVEFLGRDDRGLARFLFAGGRAIPRTD
jgi:CubicO group peptidase (beta-lactamase class C family)